MTISLFLKRPKAEKETTIYAVIFYEGFKIKYYLPEKINPKFWNKDLQRVKQTSKFSEHPEFNQRIEGLISSIRDSYRTWLNDNDGLIPQPATFKKILDKDLKKIELLKEDPKTFIDFFKEIVTQTVSGTRLHSKGKTYSQATAKSYTSTFNRLKVFIALNRRKLDFTDINIEFYLDYTSHLSKVLKLAANSIGKDIKNIKVVMNEALERELHSNLQYKSKKFSVSNELTDSIYLNENELQELENLDLTEDSKLNNIRDLFLIGCRTGLRFSDFSILKPEQINNGFIVIKNIVKTGQSLSIPVHPTVKKIIAKNNGKLPWTISNQKTNEYLKELGKKLESLKQTTSKTLTKGGSRVTTNYQKWELLTTHTARRSFATNEYLAGLPTITIMAITGHKSEKSFLRYIKLTSQEHAQLLKEHWEKRNLLQAV
jgi:integrase